LVQEMVDVPVFMVARRVIDGLQERTLSVHICCRARPAHICTGTARAHAKALPAAARPLSWLLVFAHRRVREL
jgi:hypothetical protein